MVAEQSKWYMNSFRIHFAEQEIEDLHKRIKAARLPLVESDGDWSMGTDSAYLSSLLHYWCEEHNWRREEEYLNRFPQFTCELDGMTIHFFHISFKRDNAPTLLLTHGWPDSFLRLPHALLAYEHRWDGDSRLSREFLYVATTRKNHCSNSNRGFSV